MPRWNRQRHSWQSGGKPCPSTKRGWGWMPTRPSRLRQGGPPIAQTSRGEEVLQWTTEWGVQLPPQDLATPTFHPYNTTMQSRRLDYLFQKGHAAEDWGVHVCRHQASSDHDAVWAQVAAPTQHQRRQSAQWGPRRLNADCMEVVSRRPPARWTHMLTWQTSRQSSPSPGGATTNSARASNSRHNGEQHSEWGRRGEQQEQRGKQ